MRAVAVVLAGLRWQVRPALDLIRRMNRSVTNPRMMRTAGTPQTQTSVIEHVGRNSGRSYQTPIDIIENPTGLLIALPYGTRAVATADVVDLVPKRTTRMLRLFGVGQFVHLEKS